MTNVPEIARRSLGGVWRTDVENEGSSNGGSQPLRVIGPCTIAYADFNTDGDLVDLFDTTAGDVLIDAWFDPATAANWDDSGPSSILFGETPPGPTVHGNQNYGTFGLDTIEPGTNIQAATDLIVGAGTGATDHYIGGQTTYVPQQIFAGGKYTAKNKDGANDGAAGSIDLYFLVATPTSPVLTP